MAEWTLHKKAKSLIQLIINNLKQAHMSKIKDAAIDRLNALESEAKQLRTIIENMDKPVDIMERVKSFDDILEISGKKMSDIVSQNDTPDEAAYKKIKLMVSVLNEGWKPDYSNSNERKWYPYFSLASGFGFSGAFTYCGNTFSSVGSRLVFKSEKLCIFAAKLFIEIYKEYIK